MKSVIREQNRILVLFVSITIDNNVLVINFKYEIFKMYRVLFIEIEFSKHENHDTRKLLALISTRYNLHLSRFFCTSTFCQENKFKNHSNKLCYSCLKFAKLDKSILIHENMHFKKRAMLKSRY